MTEVYFIVTFIISTLIIYEQNKFDRDQSIFKGMLYSLNKRKKGGGIYDCKKTWYLYWC